jgi:uncharacterized delta-60 repeat protein
VRTRLALLWLVSACASTPEPPPQPLVAIEPSRGPALETPDRLPENGAAGELDRSFGEGGKTLTSFGRGEHRIDDLVVLDDDSIAAVGYMPADGTVDMGVFRYDSRGRLDRRFGDGGVTRIGKLHAFGEAIAVLDDRSFLVAGYFYARSPEDVLLAHVLADGSFDRSFGQGGMASYDFGGSDDRPHAILPRRDGRFLVAGIHSRPPGSGSNDYELYVACLDARGRLDPSYGDGGVAYFDAVDGREFGTRAVLLDDGRVVVGGYVALAQEPLVFVAQFTADGKPDPKLGGRGVVEVREGIDNAWALAVDPQGFILLGGQSRAGPAAVVRLRPDGAIDRPWANEGVARGDQHGRDQLYRLLPTHAGLVGIGFRDLADDGKFLVARWDGRGWLDDRLGGYGFVVTNLGPSGFAFAADIDRHGRLVVGGSVGDALALVRYWL